MVYNPNVPASGQSLGETRSTIQGNFSDINTAFGANHVPLTTSTTGKHNFLQMPEQSSAPATAANEAAFYTKQSPSSVSDFFARSESNGQEYQLSTFSDANIATFGANPGWTFLPGGLIVQYGSFTPSGTGGTQAFNFTFPTAVYSVFVQLVGTSQFRTMNVSSVTTSQFTWHVANTVAVTSTYYWAIGN